MQETIIFIVEDNENVREAVSSYLKLEDYTVFEFEKLNGVRNHIQQHKPDLIILDVMLPDGDGFSFARDLRKQPVPHASVPIIFLTARESESDRITGLEVGGDDYVVKPFSPKELVLRVKAVLRRIRTPNTAANPNQWHLNDHELILDTDAHTCRLDNTDVLLTAAEWKILQYLSEHQGMVISRGKLLESCLDSISEGSERTIDTHIKNIRSKLSNQEWIKTVRGFGYRFTGEV